MDSEGDNRRHGERSSKRDRDGASDSGRDSNRRQRQEQARRDLVRWLPGDSEHGIGRVVKGIGH